jgi:hypothetical protein
MRLLVKSMLLYLSILLLFSCQVQQNVVGKYSVVQQRKYQKYIRSTFYITLNNDSTFNYCYRGGFHGKVSTGVWKADKSNKRIIINSFIQDIHNIPVVVTETKGNNQFPLFVFDNPLKLDTSVKWVLNVNDTDYPLNTDSLSLDKGIVIENFYLTGHIALEDSTYRVPFPLQDTIRSEKYSVKNSNSNVYYITFSAFVDYNIFNYKSLHDTLRLDGKILLFNEIKLKKEY